MALPSTRLVRAIPEPALSSLSCSRPTRCAVLGAGFAGLSVTWHLLKNSAKEHDLRIDLFDEAGIGGGASGVSGGLLHPYSPKGKLLSQGADYWKECLMLLEVAESTRFSLEDLRNGQNSDQKHENVIVHRRGIVRPPTNMKSFNALHQNSSKCHPICKIETINTETANTLVPNLCLPFNYAFYMPQAVTVNPLLYLKSLFSACEGLVKQSSQSVQGKKELYLKEVAIQNLDQFEKLYDAVIICLGAKANMLPELSGRLPLRTCRGVVVQLQLPADKRAEYSEVIPSILSDAWLAVRGANSLQMGSTWDWKPRNLSSFVSEEETSKALSELLPKVAAFYPDITNWTFTEAVAGLRAMPPVTPQGSLPLLGCINHLLPKVSSCKVWLFGGLGSRGLLYHARLGNILAQAVLRGDENLIPSELVLWKSMPN